MDEKSKIEAREHNLKLYSDSIRKDLDIILTSTIPTQKNLMKTLLWINSSIIGSLLVAINQNFATLFLSIPFVFSFVAVFSILFALTGGRIKSFGTPHIDYLENVPENKWMKMQGLINLNTSLKAAFDNNVEIVKARAAKIAFATKFTIFSLSMIVIIVIIHVNINERSKIMGREDTQSKDTDSTMPTSATSTAKPETMLSTNKVAYDSITKSKNYITERTIEKPESKKPSESNSSKDKK